VLPVIDIDKAVLGRESLTWRHWMAHPTADAYWRSLMFASRLKDVRIPVFHQSGWFDGDGIGTKLNYLAMAGYGHALQKLIVGPWPHSDTASRSLGDRDFGGAAAIDLQRDYLRWFDYWLKGIDNGILKEPLVSMFVMGSNRWVYGAKYPLPETRFEKLYLADEGRLLFTPPANSQASDGYVYNPGDPTPDAGYGDPANRQQTIAARKDVLVYTTPPFEKPYTMAGPLTAVLYASSSARDTDWFVHLLDVDPEGRCLSLWGNNSVGVLRARYRNSVEKTQLIEPGKIYKYTIDLWHTAITIAPGHRLRVEVASGDFPTFSRNLNTGGNNETESRFVSATQAVYHDTLHPSHILIPVIATP
jgi:putative CocE/NonD family hydrolase